MTIKTMDANQRVAWQQEIDLYTENLVKLSEETLSAKRMQDLQKTMRTSQLNNLLGVAQEAEGVATVRNWIFYQMGRRETSRAWNQSNFGESVLADMKTIRDYAETIVDTLDVEGDKMQKARWVQQTDIKLVRLYIGYLKRWFVARGGQG